MHGPARLAAQRWRKRILRFCSGVACLRDLCGLADGRPELSARRQRTAADQKWRSETPLSRKRACASLTFGLRLPSHGDSWGRDRPAAVVGGPLLVVRAASVLRFVREATVASDLVDRRYSPLGVVALTPGPRSPEARFKHRSVPSSAISLRGWRFGRSGQFAVDRRCASGICE